MDLDVWAGVIPLRLKPEAPLTADDLKEGIAVPGYASSYQRGQTPLPDPDGEPHPAVER